ncbi:MAG: phospho-N-acetylmuramoyl-pentapeptide-transferase [Candidatus Dormibacteraeota bacterium]|uniref:Phospho-N-acetylmuramoyl-pentapeptide-transferase n=1 Tax=Candidatus Dormiibacter inghamiae TaxID=3127013 RepID=A0A934KI89_9BACT|nr:phospho-N-acetylmuramoyl-pentapeptide-transferase [Candidatus Dormibacteraeota bacterium]MBJ7605807.1 phospho-N-acetylmuramoyl-pentapeptide-transferase [Candidatus Dormibacteraeota bacterium]
MSPTLLAAPTGLAFDLITVAAAFLICLALYPLLIRRFRSVGVGQVIQAELAPEHQRKAGTPTGGGILFVAVAVVGGLLSLRMHPGALPSIVALVLFGGLGLLDDLRKLRVGAIGIPARLKFPLQLVLAIPVAVLAYGPQVGIPTALNWVIFPLTVLAVAGAANAVNLTDGLDGLAAGLTVIALAACVLLLPGAPAGERAVGMALVGGLLAFLVFNRHPAKIFMGDMGALGLGATLAALAVQQGWVLLLLLLGLVFVLVTLSVIIQVTYFKATGGRRVFKMTPIQFTFQLAGWSENRIALTFWSVGAAAALASGWIAHALR